MENLLIVNKKDLKEMFLEFLNEHIESKSDKDLMLLKEYAEQHKICYQTAYRHAANGVINAKKIGGKWYVIMGESKNSLTND